MDHDAFREAWLDALRDEELLRYPDRPDDRIDLAKMSREHSVRIGMGHRQQAEPFFVSMVLSWTWSPVHAARTYTNEEDLLSDLLGRKQAQDLVTEPPWLRLDVKLCANMPYGKPLSLKGAKSLQRWTDKVTHDLKPFLRTRVEGTKKIEAIHAHLGGPEARMQCDGAGELVLLAVELEAWRAITLPRESDTAELSTVDTTAISLQRFAKDARRAFAAWSASMGVLVG
jgi:hypothetical protein